MVDIMRQRVLAADQRHSKYDVLVEDKPSCYHGDRSANSTVGLIAIIFVVTSAIWGSDCG